MSHYCIMVRIPAALVDGGDVVDAGDKPLERASIAELKRLVDGELESLGAPLAERVNQILEVMMAPYEESPEDVDGERSPLYQFEDETDEYRRQYTTDTSPFVVMSDTPVIVGDARVDYAALVANGTLVHKFDERFKQRKGRSWDYDFVYPEGRAIIEVPHSALHATFEDYMRDHHGVTPAADGRYGSWRNPNAKWDYFLIGGRWRHMLTAKPGTATDQLIKTDYDRFELDDIANTINRGEKVVLWTGVDACRIEALDFDAAAVKARAKLDEEWASWSAFAAAGFAEDAKAHPFSGPRHRGLDMGLVQCVDESETGAAELVADLVGKGWTRVPWANKPGYRNDPTRVDVCANVTEAEFRALLADHMNPLRTYARLDVDGWVEPGRMGWWGVSHATPETRRDFDAAFMAWLRGGDPRDVVVVVDAHI